MPTSNGQDSQGPEAAQLFRALQEAQNAQRSRAVQAVQDIEHAAHARSAQDTAKTSSSRDTQATWHEGNANSSTIRTAAIVWKERIATLALNYANAVAFADQLALATMIADISKHFNGDESIDFSSTAQLIAAVVGQSILGYLSDAFSRRNMLLVATAIGVVASLLCGASYHTHSAIFFTFIRSLSGVSIGSVSNLVNTAQNDILGSEARRQKYQGLQGMSVFVGSTLGAMVGAQFATMGNWQWFYWMHSGLALLAFIAVYCFVPSQLKASEKKTLKEIWTSIDVFGIVSLTGTTVCGLLLLCQFNELSSIIRIVLGSLTAAFLVLFLVSGWIPRTGVRPIIPFHLFKNRTIATIYAQNILFGAAYYAFINFTPTTLVAIRKMSLVHASSLMVPYFATHGLVSTFSGLCIKSMKQHGWARSYSLVFYVAYACWLLANCLLAWDATEQRGKVIAAISAVVGIGTGAVFQNTVMAIRAQASNEDSAVAIGARNVLRYLGGAIGTALSATIIQNSLRADLPKDLEEKAHSPVFDPALEGLTPSQQDVVHDAHAKAIAKVFWTFAGFIGLCLILNVLVKDGAKSGFATGGGGGEDEKGSVFSGTSTKESCSGKSTPPVDSLMATRPPSLTAMDYALPLPAMAR